MPKNQSTTDHAYARLRDLEGTQDGFHFDSKGVLTLGSGFTPIVRERSTWLSRRNLHTELTKAGVMLSSAERTALQSVESQMQKPGGLTAQERAAAEKALSGVKLSGAQNAALVRPQIEAAEKTVARRLGQKVYDSLDPKQRAELAVAAYQSPRAFAKAAPKIKAHAEIGDHNGMAARFEEIGRDLGDPDRYAGGAAILRDPSGKGTVAVHAGDSLGKLAQANGITVDELLKANPDIADPNRVRAGSILNLPPSAGGPVPEPDDLDAAGADAQGNPDADREQDDATRVKPDGDDHADASSPDAAKMKAALMPSEKDDDGTRQDGGRDELLFKSADQLTEAEALDLGRWYHGLQSSDPLRTELEKRRRDFYMLNYGDGPAAMDETGRMKPVQPIRRVPEKPTPAKSADGHPLADGIRRIAGAVAKRAGKDGLANAAKVLQVGLNLAGQALKVDGDPGPKTRAGLAATVAKKGAAKTEEAVAKGGFKRMAETGHRPAAHKADLKRTVENDVQPLFGARKPKVAAETLQSSLNDLNEEAAEKRQAPKPEPLKLDGDIGPKTEGAFASALANHGAEQVTKRYSDDLGFGFG